jgi:hypothetical protein
MERKTETVNLSVTPELKELIGLAAGWDVLPQGIIGGKDG